MDPSAFMRYSGNAAGHAAYMAVWLALVAVGAVPIGTRKNGDPIYPIAGGDGTGDLSARLDTLLGELRRVTEVRDESNPAAKAADGGRYAAAMDASAILAGKLAEAESQLAALKATDVATARKAEIQAAVVEALHNARNPSVAGAVMAGAAMAASHGSARFKPGAGFSGKAHAVLDATFREYQSGEVLQAIMGYKGQLSDGIDIDTVNASKAKLEELGMIWLGVPQASKATLGTTNATGGYVLPNNLVDTVVKPATQKAVLQNLVTVINGVSVRGVDQPYRLGAPTRMTFQDWGTTKENVNETYGSYTANLGTLARVMDISKQYARFSAGAAEVDVMDELTRAAILAENYYMIAGAGTGASGTGDPTTGVYTALNGTPTFLGYKGAFSGASNSTVAGSGAAAMAALLGSLAGRNREATAILVDSVTYWTMIAQGSDTAGFWVSPTGGPTGFTRTESGGLAFWGVPLFYDTNLGTNAATKVAIAADWKAFKLYRGMEFRIDSSDTAGDRWDKNLIGFRAEEEIGFNAMTAVHVGAAQMLTSVIP